MVQLQFFDSSYFLETLSRNCWLDNTWRLASLYQYWKKKSHDTFDGPFLSSVTQIVGTCLGELPMAMHVTEILEISVIGRPGDTFVTHIVFNGSPISVDRLDKNKAISHKTKFVQTMWKPHGRVMVLDLNQDHASIIPVA